MMANMKVTLLGLMWLGFMTLTSAVHALTPAPPEDAQVVGTRAAAYRAPRVVYELHQRPAARRSLLDQPRVLEWVASTIPYGTFCTLLYETDVVLVGEYHDDLATHRQEFELVETLATTNQRTLQRLHSSEPMFLAMEMFERDVQQDLDWIHNGGDHLKRTRPWSNYETDYRPILIGINGMQVYASNAPTAISRRVAKVGLDAVLPTLTPEERSWIAETTTAPRDEYWQRFLAAMGGGASAEAHSSGMSEETLYRYYQAQCLKDDTMAETIARLRQRDSQRQVVHLSGSFHIDYHLGIVPRLKQRRPQDKIVTVAIRPVADFEEQTLKAALDAEPGVADYVVFVLKEERTTPDS